MKNEVLKFIEIQEEMLKYIIDIEQKENLEINLLVLLMRIFETVDMHDKCKLNY